MFAETIFKNISLMTENNFYISVTEDEWQHDMDEKNYILLYSMKSDMQQKYFLQSSFLKLSAKIDLSKWNESETELLNLYEVIFKSLKS